MKFPRFYRTLLAWFILSQSILHADPTLTNVTASQRTGTRLVDIYYDLVSPSGPSTISVEVSDNGGTTYLVPAASFTGHVGAGITTGVGRKITWNAGVDHPGQLSTNMRFRVTANDGYPPDASYEPSTFEFINRSLANGDAVSATARVQLDLFVRECKRLGFWDTMVYVPCRQGYGALNTLGGAPQRTNAKFVRTGTTNLTTVGVKFNQGNFYVNHLQTPFNWSVTDEPVFVGVLGYAETGADTYTTSQYALRYDGGGYLLGSYNSGRGVAGYSVPNAPNLEFFDDNPNNPDTRTLKKPNLMGAQYDGTNTLKSVLGPNYRQTTHAVKTTGRPTGKVWFMQATDHLVTDVVQGCIMFYGDVGSLPMQTLYNLLGSTLLDDLYGKSVYLHLGGQSNAQYEFLSTMQGNYWKVPGTPLFQTSYKSFPGYPISNWIGSDADNPLRQPTYETQKNTWLARKPLVQEDKWDAPFAWIQGETDTETDAQARDYFKQLKNLATFLRQDLRTDLMMAVGLIDYTVEKRTMPDYGDFVVSGCGGVAASLNATISSPVADRCAIAHYVGLANANVTYDWTRGNVPGAPYRITKDGGTGGNQWRIHKDDVTYYLGTEVVFHPCLVATWTAQNGATGLPVIGVSRTGNIERVRKAQRDFVAQDFKAIMFDSRGCERGWEADPLPTSYDHVHMTVAGHQMLASRFAAAFAATRP